VAEKKGYNYDRPYNKRAIRFTASSDVKPNPPKQLVLTATEINRRTERAGRRRVKAIKRLSRLPALTEQQMEERRIRNRHRQGKIIDYK
jgi:hypothetical protein